LPAIIVSFFAVHVEITDKGFTAHSELSNLVLAITANITYLPANGPNMKWTLWHQQTLR